MKTVPEFKETGSIQAVYQQLIKNYIARINQWIKHLCIYYYQNLWEQPHDIFGVGVHCDVLKKTNTLEQVTYSPSQHGHWYCYFIHLRWCKITLLWRLLK